MVLVAEPQVLRPPFFLRPAKTKSGSGIDTSATSSSIIAELCNAGFLQTKGKQIISSTLDLSLIAALPENVKSASLTALFEKVLRQVQSGDTPLNAFVDAQTKFVQQQVAAANSANITIEGVTSNGKKAKAKQRRSAA